MFSNSLTTDVAMWDAEVAQFKDRYRILRYDTRGHGQSGGLAGALQLRGAGRGCVIALMDAMWVIGKAHFVGLSLGGMTGPRGGHPPCRAPAEPGGLRCAGLVADPDYGRHAWVEPHGRSPVRRAWKRWSSRPSSPLVHRAVPGRPGECAGARRRARDDP